MDFRELLEPQAGQLAMTDSQRWALSTAISTKRIADMLEKMDFTAPQNPYGEGLVEGIQNGIARGLLGINSHSNR